MPRLRNPNAPLRVTITVSMTVEDLAMLDKICTACDKPRGKVIALMAKNLGAMIVPNTEVQQDETKQEAQPPT
jgi:hypothetical protein